ncbi:MAG: plasmid partitioning protein RepB [Hyphomicrobiales bacterium]|nr:plasmid partitioning protein RepB [Hyphomicrobiales bacterium]
MRKNLLASVTGASAAPPSNESRADYARRGASRSMMMSIDELAENAKRVVAGDVIVDLDPAQIEGSFIGDRLGDDEEEFAALREAIRSQGQSAPILVRPHPDGPAKYMVVFGHRRLRAARELGIQVRAVVKDVEAIAHVILQGQENSARANLTFIERAMFARRLQEAGQTKDTMKAALSVDDTLLSRMLSVVETVPLQVIEALGPCKGVGRDRWEELKKLMLRPKVLEKAMTLVDTADLHALPSSERFERFLVELQRLAQRPQSALRAAQPSRIWQADDAGLKVEMRRSGKAFQMSLGSTHAKAFGEFISESLDELYRAFKARQNKPPTGD